MHWLRLAALLVISFASAMPAAAQNDREVCARARGDESMMACNRLIGSGRTTGAALGDAFRSRCSIWTGRGDVERALADCNEAVRLSPTSAAALIERGHVYRLRRDQTRAVADYDRAVELDPKNSVAYRWRCSARTIAGTDLDRALADCDQAIRIDSRYAGAYSSRCAVWSGKGDHERALKDCDEAIRLDPRLNIAYNNRGLVHFRRRDLDRAVADYNEAIRLDPSYALPYYNRANVAYERRDFDRAIQDYSEAIYRNPSYPLAYNNRGRAYAAKRNYDLALADFDQTIRLDPRASNGFNNRGLVWARKRDLDRAIQDYDQAIKLNPRDMFALNNRGLAHADKRDFDRAIADFTEALRIDPGYTAAFTNRGLAYERKGDLDRARADFQASLALPQKHDSGKWAHDTARERLAALGSTSPPPVASAQPAAPSAPPVTASPPPAAPPPPAATRPPPAPSPSVALAPPAQPAPPAPVAVPAPAAVPSATKEPSPIQPPAPAAIDTSHRVALVIGNAAYPDAEAPLRHPTRDAQELASELRRDGFEVEVSENLTRQQLRAAIETFKAKIKPGSFALIYFSGFGAQSNRQSYIIPVDAQVWSEADIRRDGTSVEQLLGELNEKGAGVKVVIIDASRRNPFERRFRPVSAGLAAIATPKDSIVMFSTGVGKVFNEPTGDISLFASELLKELRAPGATVEDIFSRTRIGVSRATDAEQVPWVSSSLVSSVPFGRATR